MSITLTEIVEQEYEPFNFIRWRGDTGMFARSSNAEEKCHYLRLPLQNGRAAGSIPAPGEHHFGYRLSEGSENGWQLKIVFGIANPRSLKLFMEWLARFFFMALKVAIMCTLATILWVILILPSIEQKLRLAVCSISQSGGASTREHEPGLSPSSSSSAATAADQTRAPFDSIREEPKTKSSGRPRRRVSWSDELEK